MPKMRAVSPASTKAKRPPPGLPTIIFIQLLTLLQRNAQTIGVMQHRKDRARILLLWREREKRTPGLQLLIGRLQILNHKADVRIARGGEWLFFRGWLPPRPFEGNRYFLFFKIF